MALVDPALCTTRTDSLTNLTASIETRDRVATREPALLEVDDRVRNELAVIDSDLADALAGLIARKRSTQTELATTRGLRWRAWSPRHFLVAYYGTCIGAISPTRAGETRVFQWQPSHRSASTTNAIPPVTSLEAAAAAVYCAHFGRPCDPHAATGVVIDVAQGAVG